MSKPDFSKMSRQELRRYIIKHRNDEEAIHELFVNRHNPNARKYPPPLDEEGLRIAEQAFSEKLGLPTPEAE